MKTLNGFCVGALVSVLLFSCNPTGMKEEKTVPQIVGTWEYTGDLSGLAIVTEHDFIFFNTLKSDSVPGASLDDKAMLARYKAMSVVAGTNVINDTLVTCTNKYNKNPDGVGVVWRYTYSVNGDNLHWKILDDNGKVTSEGDCKRVKS